MFNKIKSHKQAYQQLTNCRNFSELGKFMKRYNDFIKRAPKDVLDQDQELFDATQRTFPKLYQQSKNHHDCFKFLKDYTDFMAQAIDKDAFLSGNATSDVIHLNTIYMAQSKTVSVACAYMHYTSLILDFSTDAHLKPDIAPCNDMAIFGQQVLRQTRKYATALDVSRALNNLTIAAANIGHPIKSADVSSHLDFLQAINQNAPAQYKKALEREITRAEQVKRIYKHLLKPASKKPLTPKLPPKIKKLKR